jgi:sugar (pentulose or hexulose) kinase
MAISAAALIGLGIIENYKEFINEKLHKIEGKRVFHPNCDAAQVYHANYQRFCGLYPALKSLKATN